MFNFKPLVNYLKLFPSFYRLNRDSKYMFDKNFFHPFKDVAEKCVKRADFLIELCKDKSVLHFGFVDSPFSQQRIVSGELLHLKIKNVASFLFGVDIDVEAVKKYRDFTGDFNNSILDVHEDLLDPDAFSNKYDLILFAEILEHLKNPGQALIRLHKICLLNKGAILCITVPNALCAESFWAALNGQEVVHPDHYCYYSPYTLKKLLTDTGFSNIDLYQYSSGYFNKSPGIIKNGVIALCQP
jgi:predicted SAM-dependent methyltransferase